VPRKRLRASLGGVDVGDGFPVRLVGVINASPESFYGGSVAVGGAALRRRAVEMAAAGADFIDVGAMSTAPYVDGAIDEDEECRRIVAAVRAVRGAVDLPLSVDTQRSRVAAAALRAGAAIVNDISGLTHDPAMGAVVRDAGGVILMAYEQRPSAAAPLVVVGALLRGCLRRARAARVPNAHIVLDPGIGFFRRAAVPWHAVDTLLLARLATLRRLGRPLLVGVSRKSFIGRLTGQREVAARLHGSVAAAAVAVVNGAHLIRTHDVGATRDAVRIGEAIRAAGAGRR